MGHRVPGARRNDRKAKRRETLVGVSVFRWLSTADGYPRSCKTSDNAARNS